MKLIYLDLNLLLKNHNEVLVLVSSSLPYH